MLRPPSLQRNYTEFYSGDPAFIQPPPMPPADAPAEDIAIAKKAREEHAQLLTVARETTDWRPLLVEGEEPTAFTMRPLSGDLRRHLGDLIRSGAVQPGIANQVIVRCALVGVSNLGDLKVKTAPHENPSLRALGQIATVDATNRLDEIDLGIVNELAERVLEHAGGGSPK